MFELLSCFGGDPTFPSRGSEAGSSFFRWIDRNKNHHSRIGLLGDWSKIPTDDLAPHFGLPQHLRIHTGSPFLAAELSSDDSCRQSNGFGCPMSPSVNPSEKSSCAFLIWLRVSSIHSHHNGLPLPIAFLHSHQLAFFLLSWIDGVWLYSLWYRSAN